MHDKEHERKEVSLYVSFLLPYNCGILQTYEKILNLTLPLDTVGHIKHNALVQSLSYPLSMSYMIHDM